MDQPRENTGRKRYIGSCCARNPEEHPYQNLEAVFSILGKSLAVRFQFPGVVEKGGVSPDQFPSWGEFAISITRHLNVTGHSDAKDASIGSVGSFDNHTEHMSEVFWGVEGEPLRKALPHCSNLLRRSLEYEAKMNSSKPPFIMASTLAS